MRPLWIVSPARMLGSLGLVVLSTGLLAGRTQAQSIGLEAGIAEVQGHGGIAPTVGVALFLPFTERFRGSLSYSQWTGCGEGGCDGPRSGPGNRAFNAVGLFRAFGGEALDLSVGAGMGWYEMLRIQNAETDSYYQSALTFATELRRAVAYNSSVYLRGELSTPTDDESARWGFVRLGVDVRPF